MFTHRRVLLPFHAGGVVACALLTACPGPLPEPPHRASGAAADARATVFIEPDASVEAAPAVLRLRIRLPEGALESAQAARLFRGTLSDYHLGRVRIGELPQTLLDREVPAVSWAEAAGRELVIAPSHALSNGETYSVASPALGLIAVLAIDGSQDAPLMTRRWPPLDAGRGVERAIFCGDAGLPSDTTSVSLDPLGVSAEVAPAVGAERLVPGCLQLTALERAPDGALLVPPVRALGLALDPAPFLVAPLQAIAPRVCRGGETPIGPSCALVEDDRLILRGVEAPTFWMLEAGSLVLAVPIDPEQRVVVRGLEPASTFDLLVTVLDAAGRATTNRTAVTTGLPRPRVVINEVLADAIGPEPAQEWIELLNDGTEPVELAGWTLEDVGGQVPLSSQRVEPGSFVLLVAQSFSAQTSWDVPARPGTALLRLPELGKNGLANSGEPLSLRDPDGVVVSRFPGTPKPKPGISVARSAPWALDDDPASFALHDAPGASPGAANVLPGR